jgi:hypothetical protein
MRWHAIIHQPDPEITWAHSHPAPANVALPSLPAAIVVVKATLNRLEILILFCSVHDPS